jgi:hypothetical protein
MTALGQPSSPPAPLSSPHHSEIIPKQAIPFILLWLVVFILLYGAILIENYLLNEKTEAFSEVIKSGMTWTKRPYAPQQGAEYLREDLLAQGKQYFGEIPSKYSALVNAAAADVRQGRFDEQEARTLANDLRNVFSEFEVNRNDILRKQGFYYYVVLLIVVALYQVIVIMVYRFLGPSRNPEETSLVEGLFNAIDLCILAAVTSIFFDRDNLLIDAVIFGAYIFHMVYFAVFLIGIKDGRVYAISFVYLLSVLMPIVMAAIAIESPQYLGIAISSLFLCMLVAVVSVLLIKMFGGLPRLAPYLQTAQGKIEGGRQ